MMRQKNKQFSHPYYKAPDKLIFKKIAFNLIRPIYINYEDIKITVTY